MIKIGSEIILAANPITLGALLSGTFDEGLKFDFDWTFVETDRCLVMFLLPNVLRRYSYLNWSVNELIFPSDSQILFCNRLKF